MSRIRIRVKSVIAALLISVISVGVIAPVASAAPSPQPSRAILRAIL